MKNDLLAIIRKQCSFLETTTTEALAEFNLQSLCCLPAQRKTQIMLRYPGLCLPCTSKSNSLVSTVVII